MRKMKFRAWDKLNKKMLYPNDDAFSYYPIKSLSEESYIFEMMQWTGLKDIKNIEIYEGDKIKLFDHIETVIFKYGSFGYYPNDNQLNSFVPLGLNTNIIWYYALKSEQVEIIGNIYETTK